MSKHAQTQSSPTSQLAVSHTYTIPHIREGITYFTDGSVIYWSDANQVMMFAPQGGMAKPLNKTDITNPYNVLMKSDLHIERDTTKDEEKAFQVNFAPIKSKEASMKTAATEACPTCQGKGYVSKMGQADKKCTTCDGSGKVTTTKSIYDLRKTSDSSELIGKQKGKIAMMNKTAVDKATSDYWTEYFHEYGEMWVRHIPRRLRVAMRRTANKEIIGNLAPLAMHKSADGGLDIEASYVNRVGDAVERALVFASFDKTGKLQDLKVYSV